MTPLAPRIRRLLSGIGVVINHRKCSTTTPSAITVIGKTNHTGAKGSFDIAPSTIAAYAPHR